MDESTLQALDAAVEAGGKKLAGKIIAGTGKAATQLLTQLCDSRFLEKEGSKYTLTPTGRAAWEREASDERKQQLQDQGVAGLLAVIEKKNGKALTAKELSAHAPFLEEARRRQLIEDGKKKNLFDILPAGREFLLGRLPLEEQVVSLRELYQEVLRRWNAAQQKLRQEFANLSSGDNTFETVSESLKARVDEAGQIYEAALGELGGQTHLLGLARQLKEAVLQGRASALQCIEETVGQAHACEHRAKVTLQEIQEELKTFEQQLGSRLDTLSQQIVSRKQPQPGSLRGSDTIAPAVVSEGTVWEAARQAHEHLRQQAARIGGTVKIPELTDEVTRRTPNLTPTQFHNYLEKWQDEDKLVLRVCNDPHLEPRANEGITSPRGLLFYIQMR